MKNLMGLVFGAALLLGLAVLAGCGKQKALNDKLPPGHVADTKEWLSVKVPDAWVKKTKEIWKNEITLRYPVDYDKKNPRCTITIKVNKFDDNSMMGKAVSEAKTIEEMVRNPKYEGTTLLVIKCRDTYSPVEVASMHAMRGKNYAGIFDKSWIGEQVIGFKGNAWLRIESLADEKDIEGQKICSQAMDEILKTVNIDYDRILLPSK